MYDETVNAPARPAVLVSVDFYPPAYLAGGPTRSVSRTVERLGDGFKFAVLTRDRDLGADRPLQGVQPDAWLDVPGGVCRYLSPRRRLRGDIVRLIRSTRHDALYLNSIFSLEFTLIPLAARWLRLVRRRGLVVAPRGELDPSALAIKSRRKRAVLRVARALGLFDGAIWHAASPSEEAAIHREFGAGATVLVARDLPMLSAQPTDRPRKAPGSLDIAFLGRIAPIKNLAFLIEVLRPVTGTVRLSVYGPIEDAAYWAACTAAAAALPANVSWEYRGVVAPDAVTTTLGRHHLFALPSRAESYGHAINEALITGCPVLISDQTPWRDLEGRRAGWDLPLSRPDLFTEVIERCVAMDEADLAMWSRGATDLAGEVARDPELEGAYRRLLTTATSRGAAVRGS